jgi:hypothetical protein
MNDPRPARESIAVRVVRSVLTHRSAERDDLAMLALTVLVVPLTWWALLGWSWPLGVFGYDDVTLPGLLAIREMVERGGGWSSLVYIPDILGGAKGANVNGWFPLYSLGAAAGLSPIGVWVVSGFVVHALLAFLGCRAAADLTLAWSNQHRGLAPIEWIAVIWLCAFAPALGWRFGVGHPALIVGLLPFAAVLALLVASAVGRQTIVLVGVTTGALVLGLLHTGQQLIVYAAVFGAPLLLGVWVSLGASWRRLASPALVSAGALALALPALWGILAQGRSSDSPRAVGSTTVTYSLLTATLSDWLGSVPWMLPSFAPEMRSAYAHEINYPVGPLVLLLVLVPLCRARALGVGLGVSLVAIIGFSMDWTPVSHLLLTIPALQVFRVPARAALVWLWVVPIVATAALVHRDTNGSTTGHLRWAVWSLALTVPAYTLLLLLPSLVRELGALALVVIVAVVLLRGRPRVPVPLVLVVLGLASVAEFDNRLPVERPNPQPVFATADGIGAAVRTAVPQLGTSSLSRVRLDFEVPVLQVNTAFAAGLSALDGYAVPTRRFSALVYGLHDFPHNPTGNLFGLPVEDRAFRVLHQLYNVTHRVTSGSSPGVLVVTPLGPTAGPAWFSASVSRVEDLASLVHELRTAGQTLHARVRQVLWQNAADPLAARAIMPPTLDGRCRDATVRAVRAPRHAAEIVADIETAADCPLTFAMNFTEDLRATAVRADGRQMAIAVVPGYGSLATVLVPAGSTAIRIRGEPPALPWSVGWVTLGVGCCAGATWLARRDRLCAFGPDGESAADPRR